ncbi:hypothetical protein Pla144_35300 [Bythopirellula polymerisocia]|uniref:Uncharacterized protein n=1 Tax=Bythopirellula polymerisocia TaxID=2528003 RepID=A0A5C6CMF3_9BACT|nr:hypothetical protein Pla144_35300 [Bythopirellula polymerisocia]
MGPPPNPWQCIVAYVWELENGLSQWGSHPRRQCKNQAGITHQFLAEREFPLDERSIDATFGKGAMTENFLMQSGSRMNPVDPQF